MSSPTPPNPRGSDLRQSEEVVVALLTETRLRPYLQSCDGNIRDALKLYKWNMRLSAACFQTMGILEVFIRNAFDRQLRNWAHASGSQSWLDTIPVDARGKSDLDRARARANRVGAQGDWHGKVVTELSFGFWRYLASRRYLTSLWIPSLGFAFPYGDANMATRRHEVERILAQLVLLRNRIAHHEPVFQRDLSWDYSSAERILGWVHPDSARWMASVSRLVSKLRRVIASPSRSISIGQVNRLHDGNERVEG